ncbi:MAG: hypothetical protein M3R38_04295, partial [Actinomycetota bacterium]|nr:hypothetical protein [Actinomycetota bacterium]
PVPRRALRAGGRPALRQIGQGFLGRRGRGDGLRRLKKSRAASVAGGALILAGAACERWSVFKAGFQSARDPKYTVMPQRERLCKQDGARDGARNGQTDA